MKQGMLMTAAVVALTMCGSARAQGAAPLPALKVEAKPALWEVKGVHGKVFLFGSVHVMKPGVVWETNTIKEALKSSDTLYLEVADLDEAGIKAMQPILMQMGLDVEHPLSTKIGKSDVDAIDGFVKAVNVPGLTGEAQMEPMKPWLAYITLSVLPALKAGYGPNSGIDLVVLNEAKGQGKAVKGFESVSDQMHLLADFPENEQVELLHQAIVDLPKASAQMDDMVGDWERGEVEKIAALENDEMKTKAPALYSKLLVNRNERFAETIAGLLKDPAIGTVFVTIGAAHLAGPDSVLKMLETRGLKAVRLE